MVIDSKGWKQASQQSLSNQQNLKKKEPPGDPGAPTCQTCRGRVETDWSWFTGSDFAKSQNRQLKRTEDFSSGWLYGHFMVTGVIWLWWAACTAWTRRWVNTDIGCHSGLEPRAKDSNSICILKLLNFRNPFFVPGKRKSHPTSSESSKKIRCLKPSTCLNLHHIHNFIHHPNQQLGDPFFCWTCSIATSTATARCRML